MAVPAGASNDGRSPINLAFLGTAWAEPQLLAFAYDYEQATLHRVPPTEANADELATEACSSGGPATGQVDGGPPTQTPAVPSLTGMRTDSSASVLGM